jgi:8-oxo-dGTP diphosphatase
MRQRPSSRLLVVDTRERVLLFKFEYKHGPLSGHRFWATPGGAVAPGESYEAAASREMSEETGLAIDSAGPQIARRIVTFRVT